VLLSAMPGRLVQAESQLASVPPGSDQRRAVRPSARGAYCWVKQNVPRKMPLTTRIQPNQLRGRRPTIIAPRTGKLAANARPVAWWELTYAAGGTPLTPARTTAPALSASEQPHSAQADHLTAGRLPGAAAGRAACGAGTSG
jgi:hypothetical protein